MSALQKEALRRGWCPSTLKPMETGDGWLVRLHPPGARLTPAQLRRIAALAQQYGNGLIEISARANLQIRGVQAETHPALVAALLSERLVDEHDGDGPQRLTLIPPLAGACPPLHSGTLRSNEPETENRRPTGVLTSGAIGSGFRARDCVAPRNDEGELIDAAAVAEAIEARCRVIPGLPAKIGIIIDDGGAFSLDGFAADIRVHALAKDSVAIGLPGGVWLGPIDVGTVPNEVEALLRGFVAHHRRAPHEIRRLRDLPAHAFDGLVAASGLPRTDAPPPGAAPARAGLFPWRGERVAAIIGLPFGRTDAATLDRLCAVAEAGGDTDIRLSPWRGIAFRGLAPKNAAALLAQAEDFGLIVRNGDPRLSVQACAGKPACLRAETAAMADAGQLAEAAAGLLADGLTLHVSGCIKSCAQPGSTDLTLVGRDGRYGVVIGGGTQGQPIAELDLSEILTRLQPGQEIHARLIAAGRTAGPRV